MQLTADGAGLADASAPSRDLAQLVDWWRDSPDAPAGVPCGPGGLLAASLDEDGWAWTRQAAAEAGGRWLDPQHSVQP